MADNSSNISLECFSELETPKFQALIGLRSGLSVIACIFLIAMISLVILLKKYMFFTQRLILYLALTSLSYDFIAVLNVTSLIAYKNTHALNYCYVIGFADQITVWWLLLSYFIIVIDVTLKGVFDLFTERLEILYILVILLSPFLYSWIPFINLSYGPAGVLCWIRNRDLNDCSYYSTGNWLRFALYYIPLYIMLVVIVVLMIVSFGFIRWNRKKWAGKMEEKRTKKIMEKEIRPLIYYPFILIAINIFALLHRLYELHSTEDTFFYILTVIVTITYRFQGILISLVFIFDPETRKKLNQKELLAAFERFRKTDDNSAEEYPATRGHSDSHVGPHFRKAESSF